MEFDFFFFWKWWVYLGVSERLERVCETYDGVKLRTILRHPRLFLQGLDFEGHGGVSGVLASSSLLLSPSLLLLLELFSGCGGFSVIVPS